MNPRVLVLPALLCVLAPAPVDGAPPESRPVVHQRGDAARSASFHFAPIRRQPHVAWTATLPAEYLGTPLVLDDVLYTGASDGSLYALDARTGATLWSRGGFELIETATVIAGDLIVGGGMSRRVQALERKGGSVRWTFDTTAFVFAPPLVVDGVVHVATYDRLDALELATGRPLWSSDTGDVMATVSAPAAAGEAIFVASGTRLLAFARSDGRALWRVDAPATFWSLAVDRGMVYVGNSDGFFRAYDQATGVERWRFASAFGREEIWSGPALDHGLVYVGSRDGNLYALDAPTGALRWTFRTAGEAVGDPVVSNGMLYLSDSAHALPPGVRRLHALDAATGVEAWRWETTSTLLANPAVDKGALYVTISGQVIALEP